MDEQSQLSRRERQIMSVVFSLGEATAVQVCERLVDPPSQTAVRTFLRILEAKGHLSHTKRGRRFVYHPMQQRSEAGQSAFQGVLRTFFDGSIQKAVASHLADPDTELSAEELKQLAQLIRQARQEEAE